MSDGLLILGGLVLLIAGAELLVRASSAIAVRLGVSPLVIGLTIVAFGTSAPEVVASVMAALAQSPGIAIGNIVGSNISNGLLVAGATALVMPIAVSRPTLRRDGVVALLTAAVFWLICALGLLVIGVGVALLLALVAYLVLTYRVGGAVTAQQPDQPGWPMPMALLGAVAGIVLLALGGRYLVNAAVSLAAAMGVSEAVVGLTIIAVGTSLPELATSLLAAMRKQSDVALGNVIGSNIINVLGIGGLTAILAPGAIPARLVMVDFPVMLTTTVLLLGFALTGHRIGRVEGLLLVSGFALYTGAVWFGSGRSCGLGAFRVPHFGGAGSRTPARYPCSAVQRPGSKVRHVAMIRGKQGTGKSFLGDLFRLLFGDGITITLAGENLCHRRVWCKPAADGQVRR